MTPINSRTIPNHFENIIFLETLKSQEFDLLNIGKDSEDWYNNVLKSLNMGSISVKICNGCSVINLEYGTNLSQNT